MQVWDHEVHKTPQEFSQTLCQVLTGWFQQQTADGTVQVWDHEVHKTPQEFSQTLGRVLTGWFQQHGADGTVRGHVVHSLLRQNIHGCWVDPFLQQQAHQLTTHLVRTIPKLQARRMQQGSLLAVDGTDGCLHVGFLRQDVADQAQFFCKENALAICQICFHAGLTLPLPKLVKFLG